MRVSVLWHYWAMATTPNNKETETVTTPTSAAIERAIISLRDARGLAHTASSDQVRLTTIWVKLAEGVKNFYEEGRLADALDIASDLVIELEDKPQYADRTEAAWAVSAQREALLNEFNFAA